MVRRGGGVVDITAKILIPDNKVHHTYKLWFI